MKKFLTFAAIAAFALGCSSCNKQVVPEQGEGTVIKTVSVDLGASTRTRAASALAGEATINDATLFVWQHNGVSEPVLYAKTYAEATVFNFDLMFSDQTEYTYTINAWANMGELAAEPADGEVLFSNESADGVQMKGSKAGITQATAESVTIDMQRYVGKITVSEVAVEWTNEQNALQEFTLKSMYIANAGDKAEGAVATYNVGGAYVSSAMDAMLYCPVSSVIADGAKYTTPQMMYAYGSGTTELVLECELGGQTMYYHVPYEPEANTHRAFKLTIRQAGADEPLGELPEEAIVANVTTLNILGFDEDEESVDFGEKPSDPNAVDIAYFCSDGNLYPLDEAENIDCNIGIAVYNNDNAFIYNAYEPFNWWVSYDITNDVTLANSIDEAKSDFNGYLNSVAYREAEHEYNEFSPLSYIASAGEVNMIINNIEKFKTFADYYYYDYFEDALNPEYYRYIATSTGNSDPSKAWFYDLYSKEFVLLPKETEDCVSFKCNAFNLMPGSPYVGLDILPIGIPGILAKNNKFYSAAQWILNRFTSDFAIGIAVTDGTYTVVAHPGDPHVEDPQYEWCTPYDVLISNVQTFDETDLALNDFNGESNTDAILKAIEFEIITSAPPAEYCNSVIFNNGERGHLPAIGELNLFFKYLNFDFKHMYFPMYFNVVGGQGFDMSEICYLSSTQVDNEYIWAMEPFQHIINNTPKDYEYYKVRPFICYLNQ